MSEAGSPLDPRLRDYCLDEKQLQFFDAINRHNGNRSHAAAELGAQANSLSRFTRRLMVRAAKSGYSPEHHMIRPVPEGYSIKGVSTYYNAEGQPAGQWVKSQVDKVAQENLMRDMFEAMVSEIPKEPPVAFNAPTAPDLLNCYIITDYHIGMLAWGFETRSGDWDVKIAEELLIKWFAAAIKQSPDAEIGVFAQLGDFLHWDGLDALTPQHKNLLDADTRYQKLVRVTIRVIRRIVNMLLEKHKHVHLLMAEGNHDPVGSIWLRELLYERYENEPRITVDNSADPYYCYEHGETLLLFHHGHKRKVSEVGEVMVAKFRAEYGRTKHAFGHSGHKHHREVKESNLMVWEQHRTLADMDAYASRGGWISGREAQTITYSKQYGEVGRVIVTPDMVS